MEDRSQLLEFGPFQPRQHEADRRDEVFKLIETHLGDQPRRSLPIGGHSGSPESKTSNPPGALAQSDSHCNGMFSPDIAFYGHSRVDVDPQCRNRWISAGR
jgi:hypothetical protein